MKAEVRFADHKGNLCTVGMNNLIIIEDARITTVAGLHRAIERVIRKYHYGKIGREYVAFKWLTEDIICSGVVHTQGNYERSMGHDS